MTQWEPQAAAAAVVHELLACYWQRSTMARRWAYDLHQRTGTRLLDWVDHLALPPEETWQHRLRETGFVSEAPPPAAGWDDAVVWRHPAGLFPAIAVHDRPVWRLAIRVEAVDAFLAAGQLRAAATIEGPPDGPFRRARASSEPNPDAHDGSPTECWVVERHGYGGWSVPEVSPQTLVAVAAHSRAFRGRRRAFDQPADGFDHTAALIRQAAGDLGPDWASDLFFAAERDYWTGRNQAAQLQKARQDALGLGWGNHDHHTYRCSRPHFARLIALLEELGLVCRERFYAGHEAGWGAQVLEQPASGVVVFADVDLSQHEVVEDFAHEPLSPRERWGTVGLWCLLHGEALLEPGMHHLECRFDFDAVRAQLQAAGIEVMPPFTDLPYLRQAFTAAEIWPVVSGRLDAARQARALTSAQLDHFRQRGAPGSHLEILQRDAGYKGFNPSGINDIIRQTDPRRWANLPNRPRPPFFNHG